MKSTELLDSFTEKTREDIELHQRALNQLAHLTHTRLPDLLRRVNGAALLAFPDNQWRVSVDNAHFSARWHKSKAHAALDIRVYVENLDSWSVLTPFFDLVGLDADQWSSYDDAASYTRVYTNQVFKADEELNFGVIQVKLHATLKGDTDTCKRVIVDYIPASMQEAQPVYKLQCKEEAP